jgi:hypothetical protein
LKKDVGSFPAYVPSRTFALPVVDQLREEGKNIDMSRLRERLAKEETSPVKGSVRIVLLNLLEEANGEYERFLKNIERIFDDAMDRASGWYKKKIQKVIFFISLFIAVTLNVDTINIAKVLWKNPGDLAQSANKIGSLTKNMNYDPTSTELSVKDVSGNMLLEQKLVVDTADTNVTHKSMDSLLLQSRKVEVILNEVGIPMGWGKGNYPTVTFKADVWEFIIAWLTKIMGLLITSFALWMGAPFWFDLLNKLVNLRGNGAKPAKSDDQPVKG